MSWGDSWGDSWASSWGYFPIGDSSIYDAVTLIANGTVLDADTETNTVLLLERLSAINTLELYEELILGSGAVITCGFINGREVLIFPSDPPWTHFTDIDLTEFESDNDRIVDLLSANGSLIPPEVVTGPMFATIQMGATMFPIAVYGDSIYASGVGAYSRPNPVEVYAEIHLDIDMPTISAESTAPDLSPYAWLRNDLVVNEGEVTLYQPTVDTDCAVPIQMISIESYVFMCKVIGKWTGL